MKASHCNWVADKREVSSMNSVMARNCCSGEKGALSGAVWPVGPWGPNAAKTLGASGLHGSSGELRPGRVARVER